MKHLGTSRTRQREKKRIGQFIAIIFLILFGVLFFRFGSYIPVLFELLFKNEITLQSVDKKSERINVLLLGIGGGKHDGPLLTDTIIFASIDPEKNKVALVSLPRDLWIPELKGKINRAYSDGEVKQKGGGIMLTRAVVEKVIGQPVDYVFRVDFNGFVRAVDMLGGIEVDVARSFDDYEYPISGKETDTCGFEGEEFEKRATDSSQLEAFPCRYEHLHFDAGRQSMDGETALRFVRSRHASGAEGSDFARSQRQEKVISAVKDKVFSLGTILNPLKIVSLANVLEGSIDTDIKQEEYDDFIKLARKMEEAHLRSVVLDVGNAAQSRPGLLDAPLPRDEFRGQWVIIPRAGSGNFSEIQAYVECEISVGNCAVTPTRRPTAPIE
jgi:polyisoprenyl-teichoic acid--peptidoglycan teichoic acid transferase